MDPKAQKALSTLNLNRIWIPVLLGLSAVMYLITQDDHFTWQSLRLVGEANIWYMLLVVLVVFIHDGAYIQRLRILTHKELSWVRCFNVLILWEITFDNNISF